MFMIIKRKYISLAVITILFVVGFIVNHNYSENDITVAEVDENNANESVSGGEAVLVSNPDNKDKYVISAKNDREIVRSKALEILNNTLRDENMSEESKKNAETKILKMASDIELESECELLLDAKGFNDCVVFISDDNITVTVPNKSIGNNEVVKINDIIYEQTGNNNIKIVEVK